MCDVYFGLGVYIYILLKGTKAIVNKGNGVSRQDDPPTYYEVWYRRGHLQYDKHTAEV